jgi:hypothetical protein
LVMWLAHKHAQEVIERSKSPLSPLYKGEDLNRFSPF